MSFGASDQYLFGDIRIARRDANPCPVCGHPSGDCPGESGQQVRVLGAEVFPSLNHQDVFMVEDDVYEERMISPFTSARVLVARKGFAIPMTKARELGLC